MTSHTYTSIKLLVVFIFISALSILRSEAQDLQLMPMRVVFEGAKKVEVLNVINSGTDTSIYNISFVQYRMNENGSVVAITEPDSGQFFADKNVRIFPRRVRLAPGEAQAVKVQITGTNLLQPGEYRSHLYFKKEANLTPLGEEQKATVDDTEAEGISMQIIPVFGITIPVIIRVGDTKANVHLSDMALQKPNNTDYWLNLKLNRTGNMSVYGDIEVQHISPKGKTTPVATVKGIAVYTPNKTRTFVVELDKNVASIYQSGKLIVKYMAQDGSKSIKLAESEMQLN